MKPDTKLGNSCFRQEDAATFTGPTKEVILATKVMLRQPKILLEGTFHRNGNILRLYQITSNYSCQIASNCSWKNIF